MHSGRKSDSNSSCWWTSNPSAIGDNWSASLMPGVNCMAASEDVHRLTQRVTMHYASEHVMITSEVFASEYGRFRLSDLSRIGYHIEPLPPAARAGGVIGTAMALVAFGFAVITGSSLGYLAAIGLALSAMVGFLVQLRRPREYVLSAEYRGMRVSMLRTSDRNKFGRIRRALIRALESGQYGRPAQFGTATPARTPPAAGSATPPNRPAGPSVPRQDRPEPADPRRPDGPATDTPPTERATVPPGLIDEAFARYDELLLRVGPPAGWQATEGRQR